jgi:anti-sigma regulatory factor (Ser/Thr protein kinase)
MDPVTERTRTEDVAWLALDDPSAAGRARRAAEQLATQLGMPAGRVAEVGLAVTEIAANVHLHGDGGALLLRAVRGPATGAVEVVAMDTGPGIHDLDAALKDGTSTAGTLGIGLGAIHRLADVLDISSQPGRGTVLIARFDADRPDADRSDADRSDADRSEWAQRVAGITRALSGETVCGDAYAVRSEQGRLSLMLCDGSGHGPLAAAAAREAVRTFDAPEHATCPSADVLRRIHSALSGTRGGAVAVAELDPFAGVVRYTGVGNIAGAVVHDGGKRSMVSIGGVVGFREPTIRTFEYPLPPGALVVLHSDGVRPGWASDDLRSLLSRPPLLLAAAVLRDSGVRQDDASVLVGGVP